MRRHPAWYLCFLGLFLLLFLLLREERVPELPAAPVPRTATSTNEQTAAAPIARPAPAGERVPLAVPDEDGGMLRLRGLVLAEGWPVDADGTLEVSVPGPDDSSTRQEALAVEDGRFEATAKLAERLLDPALAPSAFLYWTGAGVPSRCESLKRREEGGEPVLFLEIGARRELEIVVKDVYGNPVEGAEVRLSAPYVHVVDRDQPRTDSRGRVHITFFSSLGAARFRVSKLGYETQSFHQVLETPKKEVAVQLLRILVCGIILDQANYYQTSGHLPFSTISYPPRDDWRPYLDEIEAHLDLGPSEFVSWTVLGEVEPSPSPPVERFSVLGSRGTLATFEVPLKQLTDPTLAPVRLPQPLPEEGRKTWPVVVRVEPAAAFLAAWPDLLMLRFVPEIGATVEWWDSDEPGLLRRGKRIAPGRYRFWLPEGHYEIAEDTARNDDPGLGLTPMLLPGVEFEVGPSQPEAEVSVTLAPGERYIGFRVTDAQGRPVNIGAQIVDGDEEELDNWVYTFSAGPWFRFIRPGRYKLCLTVKKMLLKQVVREDLQWPAPVTDDGTWVVSLPAADPVETLEKFE